MARKNGKRDIEYPAKYNRVAWRTSPVDGSVDPSKEGDVVPVQINEGVELRVENNAMFVAEMGEVAGQVAVNLTKRI